MRIEVKAKDFQVGMIAFLPYWGKLRKAKIIALSEFIPTPSGNKRTVYYKLLTGDTKDVNMCIMSENSAYEVYETWTRNIR